MIGPEGATYDYMYRNVLEAEKILNDVPEMITLFMVVSPGVQRPAPVNVGASFATIKPWGERTRSQFDITRELGPKLGALPGVLAFPINRASLGMGGYRETPVQFVLQADTWEELQVAVDALMARASQNPALLNLDTDLKLNKPQLKVDVNRDKLANVGISAADVGRTLETLLGGREVTRFKRAGKQYEVIVKLADDARRQPTDLTDIYLRAGDGSLVQVDNLVSLREAVAPRELNHFNRLRAAKISANIAPGHAMGEVLDWLAGEARQILPPGGRIDYDGISREFKEASQALALTFGLALAFIYLVLSAQFESFRDPLVILLSVPLAIAGAVAALYFSGLTLNVYSQIGMVMLIGLTAKNGILIVEFTRQLRAGGMAARDALVQASVLRLRPILMTSATMLLAAVPLAFAERRRRRVAPPDRLGHHRRPADRHAVQSVRGAGGLSAAVGSRGEAEGSRAAAAAPGLRHGLTGSLARPGVALALIPLASFLGPFIATAIVVALPQIFAARGFTTGQAGWYTSAYFVAAAVFMMPVARAGDLYGRGPVLALGAAIIAITSLLGRLGQSIRTRRSGCACCRARARPACSAPGRRCWRSWCRPSGAAGRSA